MEPAEQDADRPRSQLALIDLPTGELLARFGSGAATPGSGSAAALMALLSASLICAVAKMTVEKGAVASRPQAGVMVDLLERRISPHLKALFEDDTLIFQRVIDARLRRDDPAQSADKRKNTAEASEELRKATNVLFDIVELSFQLLDNGISIWEIGFRPAMGDAGAGISAAFASIITCLLVANVNLRSARSSWAREAKMRCDEIETQMASAQEKVFRLVRQSVDQTAAKLALPLPSDGANPVNSN